MRFLILFVACLVCSSVNAAIDAIQKTVLTTNVYILGTNLFLTNGVLDSVDTASGVSFPLSVANGGTGADLSGGLAGAIPYFDFPSGKFVTTGISYTNGIVFENTLGFLSIFRTNTTGDLLLNLQEGGSAGPSIQGYAGRIVVANTNLSLEAIGPFSVDLRVDGSNKVQAVQGGMSLVGKTNIISDDGVGITYNGVRLSSGTNFWASSGSVLSPSPAANVVNLTSAMSSAVTNVALLVDTSSAWTNKSKLLKLSNNGTNHLSVLADGSLHIGKGMNGTFFDTFPGTPFLSVYDVATGDAAQATFDMYCLQNLSTFATYGELSGNIQTNSTSWSVFNSSNSVSSSVSINAAFSDLYLKGSYRGTERFKLGPISTATVTPYIFDTSLDHTSGNLLESRNHGTNMAGFAFDGALSAGSTNQMKNNGIVTGVTVGLTITNYWEVIINGVTKKVALVQGLNWIQVLSALWISILSLLIPRRK